MPPSSKHIAWNGWTVDLEAADKQQSASEEVGDPFPYSYARHVLLLGIETGWVFYRPKINNNLTRALFTRTFLTFRDR
jgi:hypothetical protein